MSRPVVVTCPTCDGLGLRMVGCRCARGGDRQLVTDEWATGLPYGDCVVCRGIGGIVTGCPHCAQRGRRRAQLVLTVANLDSGAVASASVEPGTLRPVPDGDGGWRLDLAAVARELAAEARAARVATLPPPIRMPEPWRPELPDDTRLLLEADAIARAARQPWQVLLGRTHAAPPRDPATDLGRLCAVADLLLLDLVVEARWSVNTVLSWEIRYELPGASVPERQRFPARSLPDAVPSVQQALSGLAERSLDAPAHHLHPTGSPPAAPPRIDLDGLAGRIVADSGDGGDGGLADDRLGGQAVWRNGRWWHTGLHRGGYTETYVERGTGQTVRRIEPVHLRAAEPPLPPWLGPPVPYRPCPECSGGGRSSTGLTCDTCRGNGRLFAGAVVTITDLRSGAFHLNWRAGEGGIPTPIGLTRAGQPVVRLTARHRLGDTARPFGVRPEDLVEMDGSHPLDQDVRDGIVILPRPGVDPVAERVTTISRGQPGARLLVLAARPEAPPLADAIRLAYGLGLGLTVTVTDHPGGPGELRGLRWAVAIGRADPVESPWQPTVALAVADCLDYLDAAIAESVPVDPEQPLAVPRTLDPADVPDPEPALTRLAAGFVGRPVAVRFTRAGVRVHVSDPDVVRPLVDASDLPGALAMLGLDG